MKTFARFIITLFVLNICLISSLYANPPLEVESSGNVVVNTELKANADVTVNQKLNIKNVLHLDPLSSPPANPQEGDIYFTSTKELLLYANGKWNPIVSADAAHGSEQINSGSGTWTVPAGIYTISVSIVGGGGGGKGGENYTITGDDNLGSRKGGNGGNGGVRLNVQIDVVPGQQFTYSVGNGGAGGTTTCTTDIFSGATFCRSGGSGSGGTTTFGSLQATGGSAGGYSGKSPRNGSNGTPAGMYPYGNNGQGGIGGGCTNGAGTAGQSGGIYIQY